MNYQELNKALQAEFQNKRIKAEEIATKNREKLNKFPAFLHLVKLEKEIVFELAKAKDAGKKTTDLAKVLKTTREEKLKFLKKLKLSPADLEPKYECDNCFDTGVFGGRVCHCFKRRRNEELVKASGLDATKLASFDKFDTSICKNETHAKNLEKLKNLVEKWANLYPNTKFKNIVLSGKVGVGKSFITECLANHMIKKDYSVCFVSAFDMNNMMLAYHTTFDSSKETHLVPLLESDFLFIDDLGTEPLINNVTLNYLFLVLSERERFSKPVIVTTNLEPAAILDRYGERIYSRLTSKQTSKTLHIDGDDLRGSKV